MAKVTLEQWIGSALQDPDKLKSDGSIAPCVGLSLVHMQGQSEREIHAVKFAGRQVSEISLAKLIEGKCKADCQNIPGVQQYCLYMFYEGSIEPQARFPLQYCTEEGFAYKGLGTEGPTKEGQIMQGMRLTEAIVQGTFRTLTQILTTSAQQNEQLANELRVERGESREMFLMLRDMLKQQVELEHEKRMAEMKMQQGLADRQALMRLAPALINTIVGKEVFPHGMADESIIEAVAEKLTPADMEKLMSLDLPPLVMGPILSRIADIREKSEKDKERLALVVKNGVTGNGELS